MPAATREVWRVCRRATWKCCALVNSCRAEAVVAVHRLVDTAVRARHRISHDSFDASRVQTMGRSVVACGHRHSTRDMVGALGGDLRQQSELTRWPRLNGAAPSWRICSRMYSSPSTGRNDESAANYCNDVGALASVLSPAQVEGAIADWWHAAIVAPSLVAGFECEHDVPVFFLKHDKIRNHFVQHLLKRPAVIVELLPLLLLPPAQIMERKDTVDASGSVSLEPIEKEINRVSKPFVLAVVQFIEAEYGTQLTAFRRARRLADLRQPESWFPAARRMRRRWRIHLGPTNSGKTHGAAQRMLSAATGIYMSPLRLLAWEMFEKMQRAGLRCALRTGQENIGPEDATHVACTVEMAPLNLQVEVGILDEVQLILIGSRGAAWTRALLGIQSFELHLCGTAEPLGLLGLLRQLAMDCGDNVLVEKHERRVPLIVESKPLHGLSSISTGDCIICFTRRDVLLLKSELEQLGLKPSVIYGSLPPAIRKEQAALFNDSSSGFDVLVASDAIGMGLNLQIRRIVFRSIQKYDGESVRSLNPAEIRQIAGRAGRFGGRYASQGLVTCLTSGDLAAVRDALEEKIPTPVSAAVAVNNRGESFSSNKATTSLVLQAALFPLPEQLEAFSRGLEADIGRSLPFADLVERFVAVASVSSRYFVAQPRNTVAVARALTEVRLPPGEKYVFCQAPVSARDAAALTALHDFARSYALNGQVSFPDVQLTDLPHAITARYIFEMEELHKVCDVYNWLAGRFPDAFTNIVEAQQTREAVSRRISEALKLSLVSNADEEDTFIGNCEALPDDTFIH